MVSVISSARDPPANKMVIARTRTTRITSARLWILKPNISMVCGIPSRYIKKRADIAGRIALESNSTEVRKTAQNSLKERL